MLKLPITIVEDDEGIVELIRDELMSLNRDIVHFKTGKNALEWLRANNTELLLLDNTLSDMKGEKIIEDLAEAENNMPPFIVITGSGDERLAVTMMKLGAADYIVKDDNFLKVILSIVKRVMDEVETKKMLEYAMFDLNRNRYLLERAQELVGMGSWEYEPETDTSVWSDEMYKLYGIPKENETPGLGKVLELVHQEDKEHWEKMMVGVSEFGEIQSFQYRVRENSEKYKWLYAKETCKRELGGKIRYFGTVMDITHQKQIEDEIKRNERKYRYIFENSLVGIARTDVINGRIIECNSCFAHMLGYDDPVMLQGIKLIGKGKFFDIHTENKIQSSVLVGCYEKLEVKIIRKNKENIVALISICMHSEDNVLDWFATDISEIKKVQEEIKIQKEKAERADRAKSEFIANISHEIRTPLSAVIGFSELLTKNSLDEKSRLYVDTIYKSGNNLLSLINDILDLSKLEAGMMYLRNEKSSIADIFEEIGNIFQISASLKNVNIMMEVGVSVPAQVMIDAIRLKQVLFNLTGNAVKFTDVGFVRLEAEAINMNNDNNLLELIITVEDSGIGIPFNEQADIFKPFYQRSGQDVTKYGGTGLGLPICKKLIELMGGKILLTSTVGEGSKLIVSLPNVKFVNDWS